MIRQQKQMKKGNNGRQEKLQIRNNYDYLSFIRKNHLMIESSNKNLLLRLPNTNRDNHNSSTARLPQQRHPHLHNSIFFSEDRKQQIYVHPDNKKRYQPPISNNTLSKQQQDPNTSLTYDTIMEIMQAKNQQIAQSLLKERQSLSEVVYSNANNNNSLKPKSLQRLPNQTNSLDRRPLLSKAFGAEPLLKFPQLIQKKLNYGVNNDSKLHEKRSIRDKLNDFIMEKGQKARDYKSVDGDKKQKQTTELEQTKNKELLKVYYQNKSIVHLRQQPYTIIPEFQAPRPRKSDLAKKKKHKNSRFTLNIYSSGAKNDFPPSSNHLELQDFLESRMLKKAQVKVRVEKPQKHTPPQKIILNQNADLLMADEDNPQKSESSQSSEILIGHSSQNQLLRQIASEEFKPVGRLANRQEENIISEEPLTPLDSPTKLAKKSSMLAKSKSKTTFLNSEKEKDTSIYQGKIRSYRQFLFQMNLVHRKFDALALKQEQTIMRVDIKYKYYVGKGNNSLLIKSLMKRRFWWVQQEDPKKANFVWTQLKLNHFYQFQQRCYLGNPYDKVQGEQTIFLKKKPSKKKDGSFSPTKPNKAVVFRAPLPLGLSKVMTSSDQMIYNNFIENADWNKISNFQNRLKYFPVNLMQPRQVDKSECRVHNHFEFNYFIGNKKALFYNLRQYYELSKKNLGEIIPLTFHIQKGVNDPQYLQFLRQYKRIKALNGEKKEKKKLSRNVWIVKPGQNSNRGMGITVIDQVYELNTILKKKEKHGNGVQKTYIIQKYIERPMLYNRRKFDIRHYMLLTRLHGRMRAYWFGEGYIRTSCCEYDIQEIDNVYMHLTNDAIQKQAYGYGKYEEANKVSYNQFQRYLDTNFPDKKYSFADQIYPKMKNIALDSVKATYLKLDPNNYQSNFQVFGLDFMIDTNFNVYLIEVNTNPCLEINCNLLSRIIPTMLQHSFRLSLDVIFPPTNHYPNSVKYLCPDSVLDRLQCQLIFDEARDGQALAQLYKNAKPVEIKDIESDDQIYDNDGKQLDLEGDID